MSLFIDLRNDDPDEIVVPFGKHRGLTLGEIAAADPDYLDWVLGTLNGIDPLRFAEAYEDAIREALENARTKQANDVPEPNLTDHQLEKAEHLQRAMDDDARYVRLEGGAGYGKSYVTRKLARDLILAGYRVVACAVSYVATQVLAEQLEQYGVKCSTVARAFKFDKVQDGAAERYEHSDDTPEAIMDLVSPGNALIVDECSMLHDRDANELFRIFDEVSEDHSNVDLPGRVILVGDSHQLPPVKQEHLSRCCGTMYPNQVAELQIPMRYPTSSPLFQVEQLIRNDPYNLDAVACLPSRGAIGVVPALDDLVGRFVWQYQNDPTALHRMLLFRRVDVTAANHEIRATLYGGDPDPVEDDEQLMVLATSDFKEDPRDEDATGIRYYSGQIFRVTHREQQEYCISIGDQDFKIPYWRVYWMDKDGIEHTAPVRLIFGISESRVDPSKLGGPELQAALKAAREHAEGMIENGASKKEAWADYWELKSAFVTVAYVYCTSVHRAQGQTCDYAYTMPRQLIAVPGIMGRALTYVAMTRARKHLSIVL